MTASISKMGPARRLVRAGLIGSISASLCLPMAAVEIIAHRGASHDAPENTLAAVNLGWTQQADAVEIDVYLSKDNRIVVLHDDNTKRTTGVDRMVAEQTAKELRQLDAGSWKAPQWTGEPIPTLNRVLPTVPTGKRLFIEIKCGPEIFPTLQRLLRRAAMKSEQIVIIGFDFETVRQAKEMFPEYEVFWLSSFKQDKETGQWSPTVESLIARARQAELDGLNVSYKGPVDATFAKAVREAGLKFFVWTVDDPAVARELVRIGVQGITTNRPEWMRQQLAESPTVP